MRRTPVPDDDGRMSKAQHRNLRTKPSRSKPIPLDGAINWGCSGKGWNCCVDQLIEIRPYDMIRLRHALERSSDELMGAETVMFEFDPATGRLLGRLPQNDRGDGHSGCVFLEEPTNLDLRELREHEPARFAALPRHIREAAASDRSDEWRVAGLCTVHAHRPVVCRGFPFQREVEPGADGIPVTTGARQNFRCGSCALSTPTTPRAVMEGNELNEYWRANDAFNTITNYLMSRGAAMLGRADYRPLPVADAVLAKLWATMYAPDRDAEVRERFREQWREPEDLDGDREIHRIVLTRALDHVDELVEASGRSLDELGMPGEQHARPDLDVLLDPSRLVLPAISLETGAA